jgi:hypothetical protein
MELLLSGATATGFTRIWMVLFQLSVCTLPRIAGFSAIKVLEGPATKRAWKLSRRLSAWRAGHDCFTWERPLEV